MVTVPHVAVWATLALLLAGQAHAGRLLDIVQFDFEGGGGTLFVTPEGRTMLVDAGWPANMGEPTSLALTSDRSSNAQRIAAELNRRGIKQIDYVVTTHYHVDHVGGLSELARLVSVATFVDHGDNREAAPANASAAQRVRTAATMYNGYLTAIAGARRRIVRPGDRLRVGSMTVHIANADAAVLRRPLPGAGGSGAGCGGAPMARVGGEENARSIGLVARYGVARIVLLGDTTRDVEKQLVCPRNLIGPVDLMFATQHGSAASNAPPLYATVRPRVVVIGNGEIKGGDPAALDAITAVVGPAAVWQSHQAIKAGAKNASMDRIANPAGVPDARSPLLITVARDRTITVTNPRNGFSQVYPRSRRR